MQTIVVQGSARIPIWVVDLESYRQWVKSDEFPTRGRYGHLNGELWIDGMPEQLFAHNDAKMEFGEAIRGVLKTTHQGRFFGDRTLVTNVSARLSTEPDGTCVLFESLRLGRATLIEGGSEGSVEVEGSPDLVLEVVSTNSIEKDTVVLRELYWRARVVEYWLVDVRGDRLEFDILERGQDGFVPVPKTAGWAQSQVLDRAFRLTRQTDELGYPEFRVLVR
jgi:Uma2 family endonuclease